MNFEEINLIIEGISKSQKEFQSFVEKIKKDYKQWSKRNGFKKITNL